MTFLDDFDLEQELIRLRSELDRKAVANPNITAGTALKTPGRTPPQITGLALVQGVDTITAKWTASPITDLLKYEVQVSASADMSSPTTFAADPNNARFTYLEGDPNTTYYLRVRAVNQGFKNGPYTGILNTTTGTIGTTTIDAGAVNEFVETSDDSWDILDTNGEENTSVIVNVDNLDADMWVKFTVQVDFLFASIWGSTSSTNNLDIELERASDGGTLAPVQTLKFDFKSTIPTDISSVTDDQASNIITAVFRADNPGAGDWDYAITLRTDIGANSSLRVDPQDVLIQAQVFKR